MHDRVSIVISMPKDSMKFGQEEKAECGSGGYQDECCDRDKCQGSSLRNEVC